MLTHRYLGAVSNRRVAHAIVDAAEHGDATRAVSVTNWVMTRLNGLAPSAMTRVLSLVNRLLPPPLENEATGLTEGMEVVRSASPDRINKLAATALEDAVEFRPAGVPRG
jgi:hypothetical protein